MNRRVERQRGLLAIVHFDDWDLPNFELICDLNDYAWHDYAGASVSVVLHTHRPAIAGNTQTHPELLLKLQKISLVSSVESSTLKIANFCLVMSREFDHRLCLFFPLVVRGEFDQCNS